MERTQIIAVANRKGGAGKTMTTLHLAGVLADRGVRVLLVDLDAQASLTRILMEDPSTPGVGTCLLEPRVRIGECIIPTPVGLDLLPGDQSIAHADRALTETAGGYMRLGRVLRAIDGYDLLLLDTPPALNFAVQSALVAAGWALLPTAVTQHDLDALVDTLGIIEQMRQDDVPCAVPLAIIPNAVHRNGAVQIGIEVLRGAYGDLVSDPIPHAVAIQYAVNSRRPLSQFDPKAPALASYVALADRVMGRLSLQPPVAEAWHG